MKSTSNSKLKKMSKKKSTVSMQVKKVIVKRDVQTQDDSTHVKKVKNPKKVVNLKYPLQSLALLDKAVSLHPNADRTSYIIEAVSKAVENDLLDRRHFFLNDEEFEHFEKILNAPPRDIKSLKALFKEKAPWEK